MNQTIQMKWQKESYVTKITILRDVVTQNIWNLWFSGQCRVRSQSSMLWHYVMVW